MGEQNVALSQDDRAHRRFMRALLEDVQAFELMLERGMFEEGIRRIGAEQEMFLVDHARLPATMAMSVLERLRGKQFTHELAQFNMEANLDPQVLGGDCLSRMEADAQEAVRQARAAARELGADVVLVGILPTLRTRDLSLKSMVPVPRYKALNDAMVRLRGDDFKLSIQGIDSLEMRHDNVMLEACNTSFQVHFQVAPDEFPAIYNIAQAITGPLLAAASNSPLLLGRRLWHETRIAVFEHSVDARSSAHAARGHAPRVHFGDDWIQESVLEIFREDIARFRVVITTETEDDPVGMVEAQQIPKLQALRLHNGTVYRWNRACYGITDGKPHLRIENRVLPAGPTVLDEVANAALFFGLMSGMLQEVGTVRDRMPFEDAKTNFFNAAREGLRAQLTWLDGAQVPAQDLILEELAPLARRGLASSGIDEADIDRYIGVIEARVSALASGSRWMLKSLAGMGSTGTAEERMRNLTSAIITNQESGRPVHEWPPAEFCESQDWRDSYRSVGQFMTTDLFTVRPDDLVNFAASLMEWKHLRHVPVEDDAGHLVGLISHRDLLRMVARRGKSDDESIAVRDLMQPDPLHVEPDFPTVEAIRLMRERKVSSLPVVHDQKLVGIVTEADLLDVASKILEAQLAESPTRSQ